VNQSGSELNHAMSAMRPCPSCGNPLPPDAPAGLCPVCLLKTDLAAEPASKGPPGGPTPTVTVFPVTQGASADQAATLTISPDAFARVRYFGDYELLEEIARGGMGVVWKARQSSLNRTVALKMILAGRLAGQAEVQRFRREAEAAANLQHPNIVAIHEVGEHDGQQYYSMDYVAGRDLGALVRESGPLAPARAAECVKTLAEAVHFAHQRGTLHRDLKPQNVLVDAAGVPHITDFGLAKFVERDESLTQTGAAMGSPSYMPPEQAAGHADQVGPHSDVYGLGAILYELLTGSPPFRAETPVATMREVMESEPVAPRRVNAIVPPDLETVCLKCLEKNPIQRYPSARALAEELGRFLNREPIQALPVSATRKAESWVRRHPWTLLAAASFVAMVLAGMLYWQFERVKFLENRPPGADHKLSPREQRQQFQKFLDTGPSATDVMNRLFGFREQQLKNWDGWMGWVWIGTIWTGIILQRYARGLKHLNQLLDRRAASGPPRPVSQRLRVICGLISLGALALMVVYFTKIVEASVWEHTQRWSRWLAAYGGFYSAMLLLLMVVRDYEKFVHGTPSRALSPELKESLRQAILGGQIFPAIHLYRCTIPDASLTEARDYVETLAAELRAKQPEAFAAPKPRDLNWRLMRICLVIELALFAFLWGMMPHAATTATLLSFGVGFLVGAGGLLATRLKPVWKEFLAWVLCLVLAWAVLVVGEVTPPARAEAFSGGLVFGLCVILCGFKRKRHPSMPSESPPSRE
jgi:serine/threonine protein kinase